MILSSGDNLCTAWPVGDYKALRLPAGSPCGAGQLAQSPYRTSHGLALNLAELAGSPEALRKPAVI